MGSREIHQKTIGLCVRRDEASRRLHQPPHTNQRFKFGCPHHETLCVWVPWCAHTHNNSRTTDDGSNYVDRTKGPDDDEKTPLLRRFKFGRPLQVTRRRRTRPLAVRSVRRMKTTELGTRKDFGDQCPVVLSVDHFLSAGFTLPESQCVLYETAILEDLLEASCIAPLDNGSSQRVVGIGDELAYRNEAVWPQYPRKLP